MWICQKDNWHEISNLFSQEKKIRMSKDYHEISNLVRFFFFFFFFLRMLFAVVLTGVTGTLRVHIDSAAEK